MNRFVRASCIALGLAFVGSFQTASAFLPKLLQDDNLLSATQDLVNAATVNDGELKSYSLQMVKQQDASSPVAKPGNKYADRLQRLVKKHQKEDGLVLNYKVYLTKDVNAFATPDGSIRVYAGLMDMMNDDELLSVIGHEIGHVKHGHSLEKMRTAHLAAAGTKVAASQMKNDNPIIDKNELLKVGEKFINAQFSQSAEFEADAYGVAFMKRNNYAVAGSESAMRKLAELGDGSTSLFATHPGAIERAERISKLASSDY